MGSQQPPGWIGPGRRIESAAVVRLRLDKGGKLRLMREGTWKAATLDECEAYLAQEARRYHKEMQAWGESGFGQGAISRGSRVIVELVAHPETPWRDIRWLLDRCWRNAYNKVQLAVDGGRLNLVLPVESSGSILLPDSATVARVHVIGRSAAIRKPTEVRYRTGGSEGQEVADLGRVAKYLSESTSTAEGKTKRLVYGVLTVGKNVFAREVFDVFGKFLEAGVQHVDFVGTLD